MESVELLMSNEIMKKCYCSSNKNDPTFLDKCLRHREARVTRIFTPCLRLHTEPTFPSLPSCLTGESSFPQWAAVCPAHMDRGSWPVGAKLWLTKLQAQIAQIHLHASRKSGSPMPWSWTKHRMYWSECIDREIAKSFFLSPFSNDERIHPYIPEAHTLIANATIIKMFIKKVQMFRCLKLHPRTLRQKIATLSGFCHAFKIR